MAGICLHKQVLDLGDAYLIITSSNRPPKTNRLRKIAGFIQRELIFYFSFFTSARSIVDRNGSTKL
jgi:hypothetical protein